jgi:hypothetical protein
MITWRACSIFLSAVKFSGIQSNAVSLSVGVIFGVMENTPLLRLTRCLLDMFLPLPTSDGFGGAHARLNTRYFFSDYFFMTDLTLGTSLPERT